MTALETRFSFYQVVPSTTHAYCVSGCPASGPKTLFVIQPVIGAKHISGAGSRGMHGRAIALPG